MVDERILSNRKQLGSRREQHVPPGLTRSCLAARVLDLWATAAWTALHTGGEVQLFCTKVGRIVLAHP